MSYRIPRCEAATHLASGDQMSVCVRDEKEQLCLRAQSRVFELCSPMENFSFSDWRGCMVRSVCGAVTIESLYAAVQII